MFREQSGRAREPKQDSNRRVEILKGVVLPERHRTKSLKPNKQIEITKLNKQIKKNFYVF